MKSIDDESSYCHWNSNNGKRWPIVFLHHPPPCFQECINMSEESQFECPVKTSRKKKVKVGKRLWNETYKCEKEKTKRKCEKL
jgi:hypothetical protein